MPIRPYPIHEFPPKTRTSQTLPCLLADPCRGRHPHRKMNIPATISSLQIPPVDISDHRRHVFHETHFL
ncbi:hypothetical protein FH972_008410 [Carpinus fangiana]|uniref:Uncharacterized protein n=1 Tax=Carpinus fangiana TaxID=176857 RepID=A0A5N6R1E7_9ROSI|nr:hypothetical protein FH972_008410 [Carpinus fangiana]